MFRSNRPSGPDISPDCKDLVARMLTKNPAKRATATEVLGTVQYCTNFCHVLCCNALYSTANTILYCDVLPVPYCAHTDVLLSNPAILKLSSASCFYMCGLCRPSLDTSACGLK